MEMLSQSHNRIASSLYTGNENLAMEQLAIGCVQTRFLECDCWKASRLSLL